MRGAQVAASPHNRSVLASLASSPEEYVCGRRSSLLYVRSEIFRETMILRPSRLDGSEVADSETESATIYSLRVFVDRNRCWWLHYCAAVLTGTGIFVCPVGFKDWFELRCDVG